MSRHVFIHIGDTHLCASHPRNADRLDALDQVIARARVTERIAAFLWPGDLFHQKSTPEDRNALVDRLLRLTDLAPVVIAYGNHDQAGDLDVLGNLNGIWPVYVIDRPRVIRFMTATDAEAACFVLPYLHRDGLVAAGVEHALLGQDARALLEPVFMSAAAELATAEAGGAIPLAMMHVNVGGSVSSTGQPQIGREIELDAELLARLGSIYVAANHIHRHQAIHGAVYAGSICRLDFGEAEAKGYVEIEYARSGPGWAHGWAFRSLDVPAQHVVEGRLDRDGFRVLSIDGDAADGADASLWQGADIRVKYSYLKSDVGALDVATIHAEFAGCRSLKLDGTPELERAVRAPQVVAAQTVDEKVVAWCELNRIPVTPGLRDKLTALQAREADAVLADVAALVADAGTAPPQASAEIAEVA
jgi:hypothetical protein